MDKKALIAALREILPASQVLDSTEAQRPFECDGLSAYHRLPLVTVLPEQQEQVQAIVRLCHQNRIPLVARGAGTGLSGGALPDENGVLLSLAKFNRIVDIDPDNLCATVEPGVRNLAISEAVADKGLYYAPDPSSQIACSIGGNVAENAGGVHCLKYGLTVHNIMALKVITTDGELLTIGGKTYDSPGYDLLALMTGSEGLLGIIMEVTVKLLPQPERKQVILAAFDDIGKAATAVGDIIAAGIIPAGLEMMDRLAIQAAEDFCHPGYPLDAEAILLCEIDGNNEEVSERIMQLRQVLDRTGPMHFATAETEAQRQQFWAGRKAAFPAVGRISPDYYCMDGTIPRRHLPQILKRIAELAAGCGLNVANVFHAGDGNLHPLILYDANQPGELEQAEQLGAEILELCIAVGGTITGEHGVGIEKIDQMCSQFAAAELSQFHALKNAFDPAGILNPGKAVPSLHRCAELGAMHVHHGQLPHPELERF
ncbi:FAD-linked oxidase C-terminal domain-containing protein [Methylophaga sp.]|uniref:FAD-linked oxidase C-terminal domain-containing protein n=1 Tax=Methylophaga sp. TaxID=2024840 RepID=UPI0013FF25DC|nr:FAD-linked oxidase C-terminal domain-containing protein [Methylophaga sp.]MTI64265.1 FAD-binding protein [Methylophaga sp.]